MSFQDVLDSFFLREDQDAFARSQGWSDAAQMIYYEDRQQEVPPMTDREVDALAERESSMTIVDGTVEYLAPPPSEILVLARQDAREAYADDGACPLALWYDTSDELAGVY